MATTGRRNGNSFFFTVELLERDSRLLTEHIDDLKAAIAKARATASFEVEALVVMPCHLHAVLTLPPGDDDHDMRWGLIKGYFARAVGGRRNPWRRRHRTHTIADVTELMDCIDYAHCNPVRHRLVERASEWPYSSIHHYVRQGVLPKDWAGSGRCAR